MHGSQLVLGSGATLQVLEPNESGNPELLRELHLFDVAEDIEVSDGHAYVAEGAGGLRVIDLSDPSGQVEIASISTPGHATGVAISGSIACIAAREQGLLIVDVGDPSQPMLLGQFDTSGRIVDVAVEGPYAYAVRNDSFSNNPGVHVVDLSDPSSPVQIGFFDVLLPRSLTVSGSHLFLTTANGGLSIIDISNPALPTELAEVEFWIPNHTPEMSLGSVSVWRNTALVAAGSTGLVVIDVSDPLAPFEIATVETPGPAMDVACDGVNAYVSIDDFGLQVIDLEAVFSLPRQLASIDTPGSAQDVATSGDHAFIADRDGGLRIIDVSDPASPVEVSFLDVLADADAVAVAGHHAFVACGDDGVRVVDISQPNLPALVASFDTSGFAKGVEVAGTLAYVNDGPGGIRIINVSDPATPVEIGAIDTWHVDDMAVGEGFAYALTYSRMGAVVALRVVDIADPTAPVEVGTFDDPELIRRWGVVATDGSYVYVTNRDFDLLVFDAQDPIRPRLVGSLDGSAGSAEDIVVHESIAYIARYSDGLTVIDVKEPRTPKYINTIEVQAHARGVAANGGYVFVADDYRGMQVVEVQDVTRSPLAAVVDRPGSALDVATNLSSTFVASSDGLRVFDGFATSSPRLIGAVDYGFSASEVRDVAMFGSHVAVDISDNDGRILVFDVSDPVRPRKATEIEYLSPADYRRMAASGDHVLMIGNWFDPDNWDEYLWVAMFDVNDPSEPVSWWSYGISDPVVDIAADETHAYIPVACCSLRIVDISQPSQPVEVGQFPEVGWSVEVSDSRVFMMGHYYNRGYGILIIDVSDPTAPVEVGFVPVAQYQEFGDFAANGSYLFIVNSDHGIHVYDISEPSAPFDLGFVYPSSEPTRVAASAATAWAAVGGAGLKAIRPCELPPPRDTGGRRIAP